MTQYQIQNAVYKIDGYHMVKPLEPIESSFARAKAETIAQLKRDLDDVENITIAQFEGSKGTQM